MKFAVFGDIHGNIEALRAAYNAAQQAGAEKICHLGDLGGYSPFVSGAVDFLIEHDSEGVQGNYDETVGNDREHCGCKYEDPIQEEMAKKSFEWTKQHVCISTKRYLRGLPFSISFMVEGKRSICSMLHRQRIICTGTRNGRRNSSRRWPKRSMLMS